MIAVVSRVSSASVVADGAPCGAIEKGFFVLLGVTKNDTPEDAVWLADRVCRLRVFADANGKMNLAAREVGAALLVVSNFTLCADVSSRRPAFLEAARPEAAAPLYERFVAACRDFGLPVQTGVFGADMQISSVADGPVTLVIATEVDK